MPEITIRDLVTRSHNLAKEKGWYDGGLDPKGNVWTPDVDVGMKLALVHSEISEALEAYREFGVRRRCEPCNGTGRGEPGECIACNGEGFLESYLIPPSAKPEGVVVELADAVIRIADLCGALRLDLAAAIEEKHAYNATRSFRHGGKRA